MIKLGYNRIPSGYKGIHLYPIKINPGYMPEEKRKINCWIPLILYNKIGIAGYENTTQAIIKALEKLCEDPQENIIGYQDEIERYKQDISALVAENTTLKDKIVGYSQDTKGSDEDIERIQEGYKQDIEKLNQDITGYKTDIEGYLQDITGYKRDIAALTIENNKLKEDITGYHRIHEGSKKDIEKLNQDISKYKQDIKVLNNEIEKLEKDLAKAPNREELIKLQVTNEGLKSLLEEREKRIEEINSHYENIKSFANYFKSSEPKQIEAPAAEKKKPWYKIW